MNRALRLGILASLLAAAPLLALPFLSFYSTGLAISSVTPGGRAFLVGESRTGSAIDVSFLQLVDEDENEEDEEGPDGSIIFDTGAPIPPDTTYVVVDAADGSFRGARPSGPVQTRPLPEGLFLLDAAGRPYAFERRVDEAAPAKAFLVVRPGVGAWRLRTADGGALDADGSVNGVILTPLSTLVPLDPGIPTPASFQRDDLIVELDEQTLVSSALSVPMDEFQQTVGFESATATVSESSGSVLLTVTRESSIVNPTTVHYLVLGAATPLSGMLSWGPAGSNSRQIEIPIPDDAVRNPDRTIEIVLFEPTGGAALRQPYRMVLTVADDESLRLTAQEAACDANRVAGFLARTDLASPGSQLAVWFTPTGDLAGLAAAGPAGQAERQMAFSSNLEETTLLRNPERPQLFSVSLTRNDLSSDLVPAGGPGRLTLTLNPTLAPTPADGLLTLDNVAGAAGRLTDAKPGRGLVDLAEPCHRVASARDAHVFALLGKTVRATAAGADRYEVAILRGEAVDTYFLDVYPYASEGRLLGRLAVGLDVTRAGDGSLAVGVLRLLPRCAAGLTLHCTSVSGIAALGLMPPVGPGAPRPGAAFEVSTAGSSQADFSWAVLLAGTTWAPAPAPTRLPTTRGPTELACDRQRLRGFLDRLNIAAPGTAKAAVSVNLTFSASGDFAGLAYTGNGPTPERQLAFSANPEEMTLLRNPARPQLGTVSLTRNALASDLVPAGDADRLSLTVNPTLSPSPVPSSLLVLDNVASPAGTAASARPGRGIEPLLERCHGGFGERDAYVLQILTRLFRAEVEGASLVKTAIVPSLEGPGVYGVSVYPFGPDGAPKGVLGLTLEVAFDPATGELVAGTMRFQGGCPQEGCTTFQGRATVELVRPVGAGVVRDSSPYRLSTDDPQGLSVAIDFADLLGATTWRER